MPKLSIPFKIGDTVLAAPPELKPWEGTVIDCCHLTGQVRLSRSGTRGSWVFASHCTLKPEAKP